jgi:hypothetical protein
MRPGLLTNNMVYTFQQDIEIDAFLTSSAVIEVDVAQAFTLNQLSNVSGLISVFDQYKIDKIEAWVVPRTSVTTASLNTGILWSTVDYDDANPTTIGYLQEYQNALSAPGYCGHYRSWAPHVAIAAYSGTFASFANAANQWIDSASTGVQHYGLKLGITRTDAAYVFDLIARLTVSFRNTR